MAIFTDLDGSLLHRDTFKFDPIKDYIVSLVDRGIIIIPNSSKTEKEIEKFNKELGVDLPYISENGSSIHGLNLINHNFPNKIILSREKEELQKIFNEKIPEQLKDKCIQISKMNKKEQEKIFGQKDDKLKNALNRKYTSPFLFKGDKNEQNKLSKILSSNSLTLQEGGRVINLCDNINKVKSMNTYHFRIFHYHGNHLNMQHVHNQLQRNRYYSNIYLQNSHHYHYKFFRNISFFLTWR